jgi:hypothetical protein
VPLPSQGSKRPSVANVAGFKAAGGAEFERWSLTTRRGKVVKIGAKMITHARSMVFQMAEVAVPHDLFDCILEMIGALRPRLAARC